MVPVQGPNYTAMLCAWDSETRSWGINWCGLASLERVLSGSGWWVHQIKETIAGTLTLSTKNWIVFYGMDVSVKAVYIHGGHWGHSKCHLCITSNSKVWMGGGSYICKKGSGFDPHLPWLICVAAVDPVLLTTEDSSTVVEMFGYKILPGWRVLLLANQPFSHLGDVGHIN